MYKRIRRILQLVKKVQLVIKYLKNRIVEKNYKNYVNLLVYNLIKPMNKTYNPQRKKIKLNNKQQSNKSVIQTYKTDKKHNNKCTYTNSLKNIRTIQKTNNNLTNNNKMNCNQIKTNKNYLLICLIRANLSKIIHRIILTIIKCFSKWKIFIK